jgi:hypothetical protein
MKNISIKVEQFVHDRLEELKRDIKAEIGAKPDNDEVIAGLIYGTPAGQAAAMMGACSRHARDYPQDEVDAPDEKPG